MNTATFLLLFAAIFIIAALFFTDRR